MLHLSTVFVSKPKHISYAEAMSRMRMWLDFRKIETSSFKLARASRWRMWPMSLTRLNRRSTVPQSKAAAASSSIWRNNMLPTRSRSRRMWKRH